MPEEVADLDVEEQEEADVSNRMAEEEEDPTQGMLFH
jgi:hypothetical protein